MGSEDPWAKEIMALLRELSRIRERADGSVSQDELDAWRERKARLIAAMRQYREEER